MDARLSVYTSKRILSPAKLRLMVFFFFFGLIQTHLSNRVGSREGGDGAPPLGASSSPSGTREAHSKRPLAKERRSSGVAPAGASCSATCCTRAEASHAQTKADWRTDGSSPHGLPVNTITHPITWSALRDSAALCAAWLSASTYPLLLLLQPPLWSDRPSLSLFFSPPASFINVIK